MADALSQHTNSVEQFEAVLIRLGKVEEIIQSNHQDVSSSIGSFRLFTGEKFSSLHKNVNRLAYQAPHQLYYMTNKRQQQRLDALGDLAIQRQEERTNEEDNARDVLETAGGLGDRAENGPNHQGNSPPKTSNTGNRRRSVGLLVNGAVLSSKPKSLHDLWTEWCFGVNGNKPAKDFTAAERGACKYTYCRRRVFWDMVRSHMKAGFSANAAIDRIYDAYGHRSSVTSILKKMQADKKNGGHPNLRL